LFSPRQFVKYRTKDGHLAQLPRAPIFRRSFPLGCPKVVQDIGGFVPTKELTAELYVRWFQFGAFCPLFRSHGRTWKLRLPWGWATGDPGPVEIRSYDGAGTPDPSELHNAEVEIICRKYLELRYRLLPYLYSVMRECVVTGLPMIRALWLHYPDDPKAVDCSDAYLLGPSLLVAPVFEKGAKSRNIYLPKGSWFDFWTGERIDGGREVSRAVDLETLPLYVRAGSIMPLGPVKQYAQQQVEDPLSISVYPGGDADFLLYQDDGVSFSHRDGDWMGMQMSWDDSRRALRLSLAPDSKMLGKAQQRIEARLRQATQLVVFAGMPVEVKF
jgi:alpha-glucosidase (family GH31 glycosyl hydrolase)